MVNAFAYAFSQLIAIRLTAVAAPRSTWNHCAAANALDQRVPLSPSTAALAGVPAHSDDDAVAGLFCETRVSAACAPLGAESSTATRPVRAAAAVSSRLRGRCFRAA